MKNEEKAGRINDRRNVRGRRGRSGRSDKSGVEKARLSTKKGLKGSKKGNEKRRK